MLWRSAPAFQQRVTAVTQPGRDAVTVPRLLTKRTYSSLSSRRPRLAGIGLRRRPPRRLEIGIGAARPLTALAPPLVDFHHAIRVVNRRLRAERPGGAAPPAPRGLRQPAAGVSKATLDAIAACESGGDPAVVSSDGSYRGKYQFDYGTWESVGGSGDPAAAPEAEQDYRAALLYAQSGSSPGRSAA